MRNKTILALFWSAFQSFSTKGLSLLLFVFLARLLDSEAVGIASAVVLLLALSSLISDQGFGDAIVQRSKISQEELNSLIAVSLSFSLVIALSIWLFSSEIAAIINAGEAEELIAVSAFVVPLATVTAFQVALRRRLMNFDFIALTSVIANLIGAVVALVAAKNGLGAGSLVIHYCTIVIASGAMLWGRPLWSWVIGFDFRKAIEVFSFSSLVFISKLIDFFSLRILDFLVVVRFGATGLGLYSVGSKIYLTMLQLLAFAIVDVALSLFSRLSGSDEKKKSVYLTLLFYSGLTTFPVFCVLAISSKDLTPFIFGTHWKDAGEVAGALCLLGAVQSIQFFNAPLILSAGRSGVVLAVNIGKVSFAVFTIYFFDASSPSELAWLYVFSQLAMTPINFLICFRICGLRVVEVISQIGLTVAVGLILVLFLPFFFGGQYWYIQLPVLLRLATLSSIFIIVFYGVCLVVHRTRVESEFKKFLTSFKTNSSGSV